MDIRQLLRDLRQNFIVVFLAFAVCAVAGGAAAYLPGQAVPGEHRPVPEARQPRQFDRPGRRSR
jgi:hypothetical protein